MRNYFDSVSGFNTGIDCSRADTLIRYHIDSSGTITLNGQTLRYYLAYSADAYEIIDRIGSNQFIYPFYNCIIDWAMPQLSCYSDSIIGLYQVDSTKPCLSFYTSINALSDLESIKLFPNPATNYTTIRISDNIIGSWLELTDATGRNILRQQITSTQFNLQTESLTEGVYWVKVIDNNGGSFVKKLIIE